MEPASTLAEIARILRPGWLFAAYDYDWPPALNWELEQVYFAFENSNVTGISASQRDFPEWPKHTHLDRMRDTGHFRFTREVLLHSIEQGDAARFLELILTNARSHQFNLKTITEQEIGFDRLTSAALQALGSEPIPWYLSYRVRIGIK